VKEFGFEGIIAKRKNPVTDGQAQRCMPQIQGQQAFVIGGYTPDSRCRILRAELDETVQRRRNLLDESYRILQRAKDKPNENDLKEVGRFHKQVETIPILFYDTPRVNASSN
jgi:hypothetical protein